MSKIMIYNTKELRAVFLIFKQCDQMVRLFFNIWSFATMKNAK